MKRSWWKFAAPGLVIGLMFCVFAPLLPGAVFPDRSRALTPFPADGGWHVSERGTGEAPPDPDGHRWLGAELPDRLPESPVLLVRGRHDPRLYIGPAVREETRREPAHRVASLDGGVFPLQPADAGLPVWARADADPTDAVPAGSFLLGSTADIYAFLLQEDALKLVLTVLFGALGIGSFCFYAAYRKESAYLHFGAFSLILAYAGWIRTHLSHMAADMSWLPYVHDLSFPFGTYAWIGFWGAVLKGRAPASLYRVKRATLAFALALTAVAFISAPAYDFMLGYLFPVLLAAAIAVCFRAARTAEGRTDASDTSSSRHWMTFGFYVVAPVSVLHIVMNYPTPVSGLVRETFPVLARVWGYDQLFLCMFVFDLCLGLVLLNRFMATYRQVSLWNRTLEEQVRLRTEELEESYLRLQASARETAETLAELSVMEERNRIAEEIHDNVGHTLTTTIIQMEAAKMLIDRNDVRGFEKLHLSGQLVRKSLDDIRDAVRIMKHTAAEFHLESSMAKLMEETALNTGIDIEYDLDPLPPLTSLQKKVLYYALKEGLTNGIRHGSCSRFRFRLELDGGSLRFTLWNDGRKVETGPPGFGLQTMTERIAGIGGTVRLANADGGCELAIGVPLIQ
ncbi:sensor histidine kinase [Paenibacillus flagellatus]|uniref:histidine kinase n=1 Tax=Paenibacillus flagellatus TaxID=2211139 RepID=A0A2V5K3X4_9BACL|nr:sensor histidine kinase [Paenibacillus flagellatus]PYI52574.1 hypothetical protein DLM86_20595 [Paenibacillus flagellatus]